MNKLHPSVKNLSEQYFQFVEKDSKEIESFYFCDNEKDANECAELVLQGVKRATASSMFWYEINNEELPVESDIYVVTNWQGIAQCIIQVEKVDITPFNQITSEFAEIEGEGDKSLAYWKKVHWAFYQRELADTDYQISEDMLIVCEYFKVIFTAKPNH